MLQPEIPDKIRSVIAPADNASPISLGKMRFIFLLPLLKWAVALTYFCWFPSFRDVDYLL
jgi:hypothetical protein